MPAKLWIYTYRPYGPFWPNFLDKLISVVIENLFNIHVKQLINGFRVLFNLIDQYLLWQIEVNIADDLPKRVRRYIYIYIYIEREREREWEREKEQTKKCVVLTNTLINRMIIGLDLEIYTNLLLILFIAEAWFWFWNVSKSCMELSSHAQFVTIPVVFRNTS